ncbi:hypothetical protein BIT28_00945 [Photobacterium proteolyticum]|uniref:Uncharacterized protein n=1 Tax=Photobacterium proteolyticum TaxID=1903952 RepID=A0A1Q9GXB2_9GAMM|nr:hypothetical protein BIT28_00945 [Photobacterium proteolyticum]
MLVTNYKENRKYKGWVNSPKQDITQFQTSKNNYLSYVLTWLIHSVAKIRALELKAMFSVNEKAVQEI